MSNQIDAWLRSELNKSQVAQPQDPTPKPPVWLLFGVINVVALAFLFWMTLQRGPEPGPEPPRPVVIEEVVQAGHKVLQLEATNYARATRRLSELVQNGTITNREQFFKHSETLMTAARKDAFQNVLGPIDNKYLPEGDFASKKSEIAAYLESVAVGHEKVTQ